jgi:hypothetical protein
MFSPPDEDRALNHAYYFFTLSNGEIIYENIDDDANPTWFELVKYVNDKSLKVNKVSIKFRSNEVHIDVPTDSKWLYFSRAVGKEWGSDNNDAFIVVGIQCTDSIINKTWYKIPELIIHKTTSHTIESLLEKQFDCMCALI